MTTQQPRTAIIFVQNQRAAKLVQHEDHYELTYDPAYHGQPISLTLPITDQPYRFNTFPAFFDGLLPEGPQLEALLKRGKFDRNDYLGQLIQVGQDLIGAVTVFEGTNDD